MSNLDILPRRGEVMWYVIQTTTGREEELTDVLKSMLPQTICEKAFSSGGRPAGG